MKYITFTLLVAILAGCGSPSTDDIIKNQLVSYLSQGACFESPERFPFEMPNESIFMSKYTTVLNDLESSGLVVSNTVKVSVLGYDDKAEGKRFALSEFGKEFVRTINSRQVICYGDKELVDFNVQNEGSLYRVNYSYKVTNVSDWVKSSDGVKARYANVGRDYESFDKNKNVVAVAKFGERDGNVEFAGSIVLE